MINNLFIPVITGVILGLVSLYKLEVHPQILFVQGVILLILSIPFYYRLQYKRNKLVEIVAEMLLYIAISSFVGCVIVCTSLLLLYLIFFDFLVGVI